MPTNKFSKPPKGFAFATKYTFSKDKAGIFPSQFKDFDVNNLPLEIDVTPHAEYYYFAERSIGNKWEITTFDVSEGHDNISEVGTRSDIVNHLLCLGHSDAIYDKTLHTYSQIKTYERPSEVARKQAKLTLDECLKSFHLSK